MHCNFPIRQCFSSTSLIPFSNNRGLQVWIVANFFLNALPDVLRPGTECSSSSLQTLRGHPKNRIQTKKKPTCFLFFFVCLNSVSWTSSDCLQTGVLRFSYVCISETDDIKITKLQNG